MRVPRSNSVFFGVAGLILLLSGFVFAQGSKTSESAQTTTPAKPRFELTAKTEIKNGIRPYAETVYSYSEISGFGQKRERWSVLLNDKYAKHWISPNGNVWVFTEGMPGPGGSSKIWVRDPQGRVLGDWNSSAFLPSPQRIRGSADTTQPIPAFSSDMGLDLDKCSLVEVGQWAEQLRLVKKTGEEVRLTQVSFDSPKHVLVVSNPTKDNPETLLEKSLKEASSMEVKWPVSKKDWGFWQANNAKQRYFLQIYRQHWQEEAYPVYFLEREEALQNEPTYTATTPGGQVLWFDLGTEIPVGSGDLIVFGGNGAIVKRVNLIELGKFGSLENAHHSLEYRNMKCEAYGRVTPLEETQTSYGILTQKIWMNDIQGRQFVISLQQPDSKAEVTASVDLFLGEKAIHSIEPTYPGVPIEKEESFSSSNKEFRLRLRHFTPKEGQDFYRFTLLKSVPQADGSKTEVELWTSMVYWPFKDVYVADNGRTFMLANYSVPAGKSNAKHEYCMLMNYRNDGSQQGGLDLSTKDFYGSLEAAMAKANLKHFSVELTGTPGEVDVNGVPVKVWESEKYRWELGDGQVKEFAIRRMPSSTIDMLYWVNH